MYSYSGDDMAFSVYWRDDPTDSVVAGAPPSARFLGLNLGVGGAYAITPTVSLGFEIKAHEVHEEDFFNRYLSFRLLTSFAR